MKRNPSPLLFFIVAGVVSSLFLFSMFGSAFTAVSSTTILLYDAALGNLPSDQSMSYLSYSESFGTSSVTQTYSNGATVLDSTAVTGDYAIYHTDATTLDAIEGFKLTLTVRIEEESHLNSNRTGFSIVLLDQNNKGVELGFETDAIYAREGNGANLFERAEEIAFDTTAETTYELEIINDVYTLTAPGMSTLSGATRDYTDNSPPFGLPDPYEIDNFIAVGDDTTSAEAKIHLKYVAISTDTAVDPTATPTDMVDPTATNTPIPEATATNTPEPDATPTNTPQPTETPVPGTEEEINSYLPMVTKP